MAKYKKDVTPDMQWHLNELERMITQGGYSDEEKAYHRNAFLKLKGWKK